MIASIAMFINLVAGAAGSLAAYLRQSFARWLLRDVHLINVHFGEHTVTLSPTGATSSIRFSASDTPTAVGDLAMNVTTGRPVAFIGGAARNVLGDHEVVKTDGTNPMTGSLAMGTQRITGLGDGSVSTDAATKGQVDLAKQSLDFKDSVRVATAAALPANTAAGSGVGKTLTMNAVGVLTVDGIATVLNDRILTKNEATGANNGIYKVTTEGTAGVAAVLTRATDFDTSAKVTAGSEIPVDEGTANGDRHYKLTTNDPITLDTTSLSFTEWGALMDHGTAVGLADDDHTQYPLLAGRAGGQTVKGGTAASENLVIESTSHATKGNISIASGTNVKLAGDDDIVPTTDNQGEVGTDVLRMKRVRAVAVVSGDLILSNGGGGKAATAEYRLIEQPQGIRIIDEISGRVGWLEIDWE